LVPVKQNQSPAKFTSGSNTSLDEQLIKYKHYGNYSGQLHTKLFEAKWYHSLWYLKYRKAANRLLALIIGTGAIILLAA
jgi:hypothetical protein